MTPRQSTTSRRDFLLGVGAASLAAIWPVALAQAATATADASRGRQATYRALTARQAEDFGAIADRIIPRDDAPGARDLGVVFFADQLFASFSPERKPAFDKALADVNAAAKKVAPRATSFAAMTTKQQDDTLQSIETTDAFNLLRTLTVSGYFSHPSRGGNRNSAGWKAIGLEDRMSWTPPFGYYDRPEVMARLMPGRRG
jgi:gluconate 2-dehydrogenase gamma chain